MEFLVTVSTEKYEYASDEIYVEALRQIIEGNFYYAHRKYGLAFSFDTVYKYPCVQTAISALARNGYTVNIMQVNNV